MNQVDKSNQNHFVMKTFFRITHSMVIKNRGYTHNFQDVLKLVGDCGGNEVKTRLIFSPKNAIDTSLEYIGKVINIIDDYIKLPLLASLREKRFAFFSDETQGITSVEQMAVYVTFEHNGVTAEHFVGIYSLSNVVGTSLFAANIMKSLEEYFQDQSADSTRT